MLIFAFFWATGALLLQGVLLPGFALFAYAPYLALVALQSSKARAFWLAALAGLSIDLVSNHPFGIHAVACTAAMFFLFRWRNRFLSEKPLHLALFSTLFSAALSWVILILLFLFDRRIPFAGIWVFGDLLLMSLVDGMFAVIWFSGPLALFARARRYWVRFWLKKHNLSPHLR